jgi:hypothetical protein
MNNNWKTKAATDDLHHHCSIQVKRNDHKSVARTVWKQRYTLQKQKSGHHTIHLENYIIQRQMYNKDSMRNELKRIDILRVKPFEV